MQYACSPISNELDRLKRLSNKFRKEVRREYDKSILRFIRKLLENGFWKGYLKRIRMKHS